MAREYLWIYAGGCVVMALGFLLGASGIALEGAGPQHWSRVFQGWCPFAPWPTGYTWLGFVVLGVALTGGGLGITRQKRAACLSVALISLYELGLSALAVLGRLGQLDAKLPAAIGLCVWACTFCLCARLGLALRRTPPRDFSVRQETVSGSESAT